jgi:hypothetical protein
MLKILYLPLVPILFHRQVLRYNHTGTNYFTLRRDRGLQSLASTAKEIMREALPIQCVEGVFLSVYLTSGMREVLLLLPAAVFCK